jgi:hypothetical protein
MKTAASKIMAPDLFEVDKPTASIIPAIKVQLNAYRQIPGIIYCNRCLQGPSFFFLSQLQVNGKNSPTK